VHSVYFVSFWFTRRADRFRGFVGNLNDMKPGSVTQIDRWRRLNRGKPTNGFVVGLRGTREDWVDEIECTRKE
jgi:hypothetical protein